MRAEIAASNLLSHSSELHNGARDELRHKEADGGHQNGDDDGNDYATACLRLNWRQKDFFGLNKDDRPRLIFQSDPGYVIQAWTCGHKIG